VAARGQRVGNGLKMADENTYISSALTTLAPVHVPILLYFSVRHGGNTKISLLVLKHFRMIDEKPIGNATFWNAIE